MRIRHSLRRAGTSKRSPQPEKKPGCCGTRRQASLRDFHEKSLDLGFHARNAGNNHNITTIRFRSRYGSVIRPKPPELRAVSHRDDETYHPDGRTTTV